MQQQQKKRVTHVVIRSDYAIFQKFHLHQKPAISADLPNKKKLIVQI